MGNAQAPATENTATYSDSSPRDSDNGTLVVLCDYPSADVCEPIFRLGERLRLVSEEGYWWKVCSILTKVENDIPHCHVAKVYHGWLFEGVARPKAEELLRLPSNRVGSFMIRESAQGVYTLSVRHRSVKHYRISRLPNHWYFISPGLTFQCLENLVNHYSETADGLCCVLTGPCLATTDATLSPFTQASPRVLQSDFDWTAVDSSELIHQNTGGPGNRGSMISYGVQDSVASYLSLAGVQEKQETRRYSWRRKKRRSVYALPDHQLRMAVVEDTYEQVP